MKSREWLHLICGGLLIGLLRGITEVFRLGRDYPVNADVVSLSAQVIPAYGFVIAAMGLGFAVLAAYLFRQFNTTKLLLPISWFIALALIDLSGFLTPVSPACRFTRGMPPQHSTPENPHDLLIVTLDTCRADYLGAYGNPVIRTPMMDRMAQKGVTIAEAIAPIPITTSSHATLMTGQDPPEHGSRFNAVPIRIESRTMAEKLRDYGYQTGAFISAFPVMHEVSGLGRGFDIYDQLLTPSRFHPLFFRSTLMRGLTRFGPFRPAERKWFRVVPSVKKWWSGNAMSPRFSWVHFYDPHFPYQPGFPFDRMYLERAPEFKQSVMDVFRMNREGRPPPERQIHEYIGLYMGEISAVDVAVQELIRNLYDSRRLSNTCIVLTADHGESLQEHSYYFSHGDNLHDPSIRIPLIAVSEKALPANRIITGQTRLASVAGAVYALLGLDALIQPEDRIIAETWKGLHASVYEDIAYCETGSGVYTKAHVPSRDQIRSKQRAIRTGLHKVILKGEGNSTGYNLVDDPGENNPLPIADSPDLSALEHQLNTYIEDADPSEGRAPNLPDESTLMQLRMLGYLD